MDHLLWDRESRPDEIYRMKGLLSVTGSDKKHSLQVGGGCPGASGAVRSSSKRGVDERRQG